MPFDFINHQNYSIDYSKLFNEFNSQEILNDMNIQVQYLKLWINALIEHDNILTNQLKTKEDIAKMILRLQSEPEIFQLPVNYKNNQILLHFRVSITNEIISRDKREGEFISLDDFLRKDSSIHWTPVKTNVDSYADAKEPIVIVPFLNGQYSYLVIDGNHRLTYKTKNKINNVHALMLAEQSVIECSLFSSSFDKLYYIMHNEIMHMANETHYNNADAYNLVQKSFLRDGVFKFK